MTAQVGYKDRQTFNQAGGKLFFGRLISAIDGSQVKLPYTAELKAHFWTSGQGDKAVTGRCSVLYDIQNDIILDAHLDPFSHGERSQALEMLEKKHIFSGIKELVIFDRGYYSLDFMEELLSRRLEFIFRMPTKRLSQADELTKGIHTIKITLNSGKSARIRIIKFDLPNGVTETLVTSFYLRACLVFHRVRIFEHNFIADSSKNPQEYAGISRIFRAVCGKICQKGVRGEILNRL